MPCEGWDTQSSNAANNSGIDDVPKDVHALHSIYPCPMRNPTSGFCSPEQILKATHSNSTIVRKKLKGALQRESRARMKAEMHEIDIQDLQFSKEYTQAALEQETTLRGKLEHRLKV